MAITYFLLSILIGLITLILYWLYRSLNYWKDRGIPYDQPHPFFGNVQGFRSNRTLHEVMFYHYNKFRKHKLPFVGFYFMNKPSAFIMDTKLAKNILIKDFSNFSDRGLFSNEIDDPLSAHLFNLDGPMWKQLRHKLTPTFTSGKMKHMFPSIVKISQEFLHVIEEEGVLSPDGCILDLKDLNARFTTDVIGTCAFGIECNSLRNVNVQFGIMGRKALTDMRHNIFIVGLIMAFPQMARRLRMRLTPDDVHNFFMDLVQQTVALREQEKVRRNDFMDMLIDLKNNKNSIKAENGEDHTALTLNEISAQAFVFFLAGFETSSSTMSYALYELAQHQHIQNKMRAEINRVLEKHNHELSYECIKDMQYVDQVISETLRMYTLVPMLDRKALKDYVVPDHPELIIEAGTQIVIPACAYHRDSELYPEPEIFNPERFSPEMVAARDSVQFLGFGDGPRNCIGMRFGQMQTRVGLTQLIKNYKFSVCQKTDNPMNYDPKSFVLSKVGGIYLRVERV